MISTDVRAVEAADLEALRRCEVLDSLDLHFARTLARLAQDPREEVALAIALASRQVREGHVCLDLAMLCGNPRLPDGEGRARPLSLPSLSAWSDILRSSPAIGDASAVTPLVLDERGRLYLRRYFEHERALARSLAARAAAGSPLPQAEIGWLRDTLARLFGRGPGDSAGVDWQQVAAVVALERRLTVISGRPGTGKTFTVVKVLALLIEQAIRSGRPLPRIVLAAPTGKAAARLNESIRGARATLECAAAVREAMPDNAGTIHRLLGSIGGSSTRFRHNAERQLAADIVLIDEASMVDLALMRRLIDAVPDSARLILLGDKNQLASVEAGAVLGDICNTGTAASHSKVFRERWQQLTGSELPIAADAPAANGIWDCVVELRQSYRYSEHSGIHRLAEAINAGDADTVLALLDDASLEDVRREAPLADGSPPLPWLRTLSRGFTEALTAGDPAQRLHALRRCRLLCAHRRGRSGVVEINRQIESLLEQAGEIDTSLPYYAGRPLIITRNDYQVQLFNGDTGLLIDVGDGVVSAVFEGGDGELRRLAPARLPAHETVFAMSVHKSQGSEFDEVALLLPGEVSPVLSRELVYTGVTRARSRVAICGTREVIAEAVRRRVERSSGLRDTLWSASGLRA